MEGMHNRKLFDLLVSWLLAYFVIIGAFRCTARDAMHPSSNHRDHGNHG